VKKANGVTSFLKTIDMRPEINAIAQVEGEYVQQTGIAKWTFSSLDPMTMEPTNDLMQGILPVNFNGTSGIGEVMFEVGVKPNKADGTQIAKGSYTFKDYTPDGSGPGYGYGTIETTDAPILFPFDINTEGKRTNAFHVAYVDPNVLALISDKGAGDWGECTWWRFKNASDADAALAGNGQRAWTWNTIDGATWGNAGYNGGLANAAGDIPGKWWGCTPEQLETEQLAHSGNVVYGYGSDDAYMVFDSANGTVTSYKADGSQIASSPYEVSEFDMNPALFKKGTITTTDGSGILFPFAINQNGAVTTEYEIVYLDGTIMSLIGNYAGSGDWGECTWWRFKPKN
jgi:hypothetical protein